MGSSSLRLYGLRIFPYKKTASLSLQATSSPVTHTIYHSYASSYLPQAGAAYWQPVLRMGGLDTPEGTKYARAKEIRGEITKS